MASQNLQDLAERWLRGIDASLPAAIELRHELHASPNLSGQEDPTSRRVLNALGDHDFEVETVAGTGRLLRQTKSTVRTTHGVARPTAVPSSGL